MKVKMLLNIAVLLFLLAPSQAQTTVYTKVSQPVRLTYFFPCINGGAGEVVTLKGTMQTVLAETTFATNGWIIDRYDVNDLDGDDLKVVPHFTMTGLGQTTGITYQYSTSETFTDKLSPVKVANGLDQQNWTVIGGGMMYGFHEDYRYTRTAAGVWSYAFDNGGTYCAPLEPIVKQSSK